jgi:hypothetical protein
VSGVPFSPSRCAPSLSAQRAHDKRHHTNTPNALTPSLIYHQSVVRRLTPPATHEQQSACSQGRPTTVSRSDTTPPDLLPQQWSGESASVFCTLDQRGCPILMCTLSLALTHHGVRAPGVSSPLVATIAAAAAAALPAIECNRDFNGVLKMHERF